MQELINQNIGGASNILIEQYRDSYKSSLFAVDNDVRNLVASGKEMQAALLTQHHLACIESVYDGLTYLYTTLYNARHVLERFDSQKLKEIGFELQPPYQTVAETQRFLGQFGGDPDEIVIEQLSKLGFEKEHWLITSRILSEIEYMLHCLSILIEPDFVPLQIESDQNNEGRQDRYISSAVKLAVWRRDQGKCVNCESKERLEYDHIIPVSKGGSNTERNIQLLCQTCNRQKSANIL